MKKIISLLSMAIIFTMASCGNEKAETKKEVIVVPAETPKKEVIIVPATPPAATEKGTSVSMDKNGVKVEVKK